MSRFTFTLHSNNTERSDCAAIIGYDRPMRTYFVQAFDDENGMPTVWYGQLFEQFKTFDELITLLSSDGYQILDLNSAFIETMHLEAASRKEPSLAELHGLLHKSEST